MTQMAELTTDVILKYDKSSVAGFLKINKEIAKELKDLVKNTAGLKELLKVYGGANKQASKLVKTTQKLKVLPQVYNNASESAKKLAINNKKVNTSLGSMIAKYSTWAAAVAIVKKSVTSFAEFEDVILQTQATLGGTTKDFNILRKTAMGVGASTRFTAKEAAGAQLSLVRAGIAAKNTGKALKPLINLSTVTGESMGMLTDQVMRTRSGFKLSEDQISDLADTMFKAASTVSMSVGNIGAAYQKSAGMAKLAGLDYKETAKYIALMSSVTVGEEAGTALTSSLQRLARAPKEVQDAMKVLRVTNSSVGGQLVELREKFKGLNSDMQLKLGTKLFGQHAKSMLAIMTTTDKEFARVSDSIDNSSGSLAKGMATMNKGLMGNMKSLGSIIGSLAINFANFLAPAIIAVLKAIKLIIVPLNAFIGFLNKGAWYTDVLKYALLALTLAIGFNIAATKLMGIALIANAATHGIWEGVIFLSTMAQMGFTTSLVAGVATLGTLAAALWTAVSALWAFLLPFLPIIAGMAALAAAIYLVWKYWDKLFGKKDLKLSAEVTKKEKREFSFGKSGEGIIDSVYPHNNTTTSNNYNNTNSTSNKKEETNYNYTFNTTVADNQQAESRQKDDIKIMENKLKNGYRR